MISFSEDLEYTGEIQDLGVDWDLALVKAHIENNPSRLSINDVNAIMKIAKDNKDNFSSKEMESINSIAIQSFLLEIFTPEEISNKLSIEDKSKTPGQILQEMGISQEEFQRAAEPEFVAMEKHPSQLSEEELKQKIRESGARLKNHVGVKSADSVPMPTQDVINEKYIRDNGLFDDGDDLTLNKVLEILKEREIEATGRYLREKSEYESIPPVFRQAYEEAVKEAVSTKQQLEAVKN